MGKYIFDKSNGLWYECQGDYYIPCLSLPAEEEQTIGISFQYPSDWELFEVGGMSVSITHNTADHTVVFEVVNTLQPNPFGIFTDDNATIETAVSQSGNTTVQSIEDATISGSPVRVLNYRTGRLNGTEPVVVRSCYYINGDSAYSTPVRLVFLVGVGFCVGFSSGRLFGTITNLSK